jgi:hypothetical protein
MNSSVIHTTDNHRQVGAGVAANLRVRDEETVAPARRDAIVLADRGASPSALSAALSRFLMLD